MKVSKKMKKVSSLLVGFLVLGGVQAANATSLIDATATTAIQSGYTDMIDTMKNVLTISWPFLLGAIGLMMAPKLIKKVAHMF